MAVIQDPATNTTLHPVTGGLYKVLHLGMFLDAHPGTTMPNGTITPSTSLTGLVLNVLGNLTIVPAQFIVSL